MARAQGATDLLVEEALIVVEMAVERLPDGEAPAVVTQEVAAAHLGDQPRIFQIRGDGRFAVVREVEVGVVAPAQGGVDVPRARVQVRQALDIGGRRARQGRVWETGQDRIELPLRFVVAALLEIEQAAAIGDLPAECRVEAQCVIESPPGGFEVTQLVVGHGEKQPCDSEVGVVLQRDLEMVARLRPVSSLVVREAEEVVEPRSSGIERAQALEDLR